MTRHSSSLLLCLAFLAIQASSSLGYAFSRGIVDIHSDVVFIGFPASSLEVVRDRWLDSLGRTDDALATIGPHSESTLRLPGSPAARHHFHLVQISFHVADALRARLKELMREEAAGSGRGYYFNSWEIDGILQGLSDVIGATHITGGADSSSSSSSSRAKSVKPQATIFILNLDLSKGSSPDDDLPSYTYRNGFSDADLALLAADDAVLQLSRRVAGADKRSSRLDVDATKAAPPLRRLQPRDDSEYLQDDPDSGASGNNLVHWRDAVKETRQWAAGVRDETEKLAGAGLFTLQERALRILGSSDEASAIMKDYRLDLARSVTKIAAAAPRAVPSDEANGCSSETWFGAGRAVWIDMLAARSPPYYLEYGNSLNAPSPRALTQSEWLRLGDGASKKGVEGAAGGDSRTRTSLQRQKSELQSLLSQSKCPAAVVNEMRADLARLPADSHIDAILARVVGELHPQAQELKNAPSARACAQLQLQLQQVLLETHERPALNISRVSEEAAVYLGHVSALLLRLNRFYLAPPLSLQPNPVAAPSDLKVFGGTAAAAAGGAQKEQSLLELVHVWRLLNSDVGASPLAARKSQLTAWQALLPSSLVPSRVEIAVYIIKLHTAYAALADFDYWSLMKETSRLRLPNQQMTLTVHEVDATHELALGLGLKACRRSELVSSAGDDFSRRRSTFTAEYTEYLDSQCIWSYLQHHDQGGEQRRAVKGHTLHLPIFVVSMASPEPTYLDGLHLAVNVGNAVLVVQNSQEAIPSALMCGSEQVLMDGRSPLSPALAAVARVLLGAAMRHTGHCGRASTADMERLLGLPSDGAPATRSADEKGQDWSLGLGASPLFEALSFATPHFSQAEVEVAHRGRLHRSLAVSAEIATLYDVHDAHAATGSNSSSVALLDKIEWLGSRALRALQAADFASAASLSNELYLLTLSHLPQTDRLAGDLKAPEKEGRKRSASAARRGRESTVRRVGAIRALCSYVVFPLTAFGVALLVSQLLSRLAVKHPRKAGARGSKGSWVG